MEEGSWRRKSAWDQLQTERAGSFGASAPGAVAKLGFNVENVVKTGLSLVKRNKRRVST